jgi:hypothetical protein
VREGGDRSGPALPINKNGKICRAMCLALYPFGRYL